MCTQYGEIIASQRKKLNLSLQDLGNVVGYTAQAISRFEKGVVQIDMRLWGDLCKALNISVRSFVVGDLEKLTPWESGDSAFNEKKFSESIEYCRDRLLLSKKDLAEKLSINPQKVSKWEKGASLPSIIEFVELANLFDYDYEDFYFSRQKKEENELQIPAATLKKNKGFRKAAIISLSILSGLLVSSFALNLYQTFAEKDEISSSSTTPNVNPINETFYTVTYHYLETGETKEKQVRQGDLAPYLNYDLKGHYLVGYQKENGEKWNFENYTILGDTDLYGVFKKETYQITFKEAMGGITLKKETVEYLGSATPPSLAPKTGYVYQWVGQYKNVEEDATIYPKWGLNCVTLKIELSDGESFKDSASKEYTFEKYSADSFSLLPEVLKENHFQNGFTYAGAPFTRETVLENNMVIHPSWIKNEFHYRFNHTSLEDDVRLAHYGDVISTLPTPIEEGKEFDFWSINKQKIELPWTYNFKEDVLLEPNWKGTKFNYDVDRYGKLTLKNITDVSTDVLTIPADFNGTPISRIKENLLTNNSTVKTLNIMGDGMEIEEGAFRNLSSLEEVRLPNVTEKTVIHQDAFKNCRSVKYIETGRPNLYQGDYSYTVANLHDFGLKGSSSNPLKIKISNNVKHTLNSFFFGTQYVEEIEFGDKQDAVSANNLNLQTEHLKRMSFDGEMKSLFYFDAKNLDTDNLNIHNTNSSLSINYTSLGGRIKNLNIVAKTAVFNNVRFLNVANLVLNNCEKISFHDNVRIEAENIYLPAKEFAFGENVKDIVFYAPNDNGINVHFFGCDEIPAELKDRKWIDTTCPVNYIFHETF